MKIGLYGIRGTYNFGCEAIVRGATKLISDLFPQSEVIYFSYSYEYDTKALNDLGISIVPIIEKRNLITRILNKSLQILGSEKRVFPFKFHKLIDDVDLIFSIGGDIYTIPVFLREQKKYRYYNSLVDFCERSRKPIVVYGASVGPWGNYKKAVKYYRKNLMKYKAILCREKDTVNYLVSLGFKNALFFPDPAFQLGEQKNNQGDYIGVNLSPLSLREIYGDHFDEHVDILAGLIDEVYEKTGRDIMFLPHVLSDDAIDNDLLFLVTIRNKMIHSEHVTIADSKFGFLGIKESLRNCFIVISARMHCAINAVEENVPTIFLSYSQKSIGMCEYIYGNKKWVLSLKDVESNLIPMVMDMCNDRNKISSFLNEQNERIKRDYTENIEQIKGMLDL